MKSFNPLFIRSVFLLVRIYQMETLPESFQSLIHQVSVSFHENGIFLWLVPNMFQSLIHQVSVSFVLDSETVFTARDAEFQSLIHQVSVSFERSGITLGSANQVSIPYSSGQCFFCAADKLIEEVREVGFNPLFIRSVFLFQGGCNLRKIPSLNVSIPYSSGQCFFS